MRFCDVSLPDRSDALCWGLTRMEGFASMFAERGYTCLEIDLAQPTQTPSTSQALMKHYESGASLTKVT